MTSLDRTSEGLEAPIEALRNQLYIAFKRKFNPNSGLQLSQVLLDNGFNLTERTEKGQFKTDKDTLHAWITDPRIQLLAAYKFLSRAQSTLSGYRRLVHNDNRMYPDYRQTTTTGRAACQRPNLMNIPKQRGRISEVEVGDAKLADQCAEAFRTVRSVFIPSPGNLLVSMDYDQGEYRIAGHYSQSSRLLGLLNEEGSDFHKVTCNLVFGEYNPRLRHIVKIINYGLLYGMGNELLYTRLKVDGHVNDGPGVITRYQKQLPEMRQLQKKIKQVGQARGFVQDPLGRKYRFFRERPHALVSA